MLDKDSWEAGGGCSWEEGGTRRAMFKPEDVRIPYDEYNHVTEREPKEAPSKINPSYYKRWKVEPIDFCMENDLPFWLGSALKYLMRYDQKNGLEDLYKAKQYIDFKIKELEKNV